LQDCDASDNDLGGHALDIFRDELRLKLVRVRQAFDQSEINRIGAHHEHDWNRLCCHFRSERRRNRCRCSYDGNPTIDQIGHYLRQALLVVVLCIPPFYDNVLRADGYHRLGCDRARSAAVSNHAGRPALRRPASWRFRSPPYL
jgi:hypothetical protein